MVVLPMRQEIKHDLELLEKKVMCAQSYFDIKPRLRCSWICTPEEMELYVSSL